MWTAKKSTQSSILGGETYLMRGLPALLAALLASIALSGCGGREATARAWGFVDARARACEAKADWVDDRWPFVEFDEGSRLSHEIWLRTVAEWAPAGALAEPTRQAMQAIVKVDEAAAKLVVEAYGSAESLCSFADNPVGLSKVTFLEQRAHIRQALDSARSKLALHLRDETKALDATADEVERIVDAATESERQRLQARLAGMDAVARVEKERRDADAKAQRIAEANRRAVLENQREQGRLATALAEAEQRRLLAEERARQERERERAERVREAEIATMRAAVREWSDEKWKGLQPFGLEVVALAKSVKGNPVPWQPCNAMKDAALSWQASGIAASGSPEFDRQIEAFLDSVVALARACQGTTLARTVTANRAIQTWQNLEVVVEVSRSTGRR